MTRAFPPGCLPVLACLLLAGCGKGKEPEATVFNVSSPPALTAEGQTLSVPVQCDIPWQAAVQDASWARIQGRDETGVQVAVGFNPDEPERSGTLVVTAGKQQRTVSIVQRGITSVVTPLSLELHGTDPSRLDVHLLGDWSVTLDPPCDWLALEKQQGSGGLTRIRVIPADANENVGPRTTAIVLSFGGETVRVPVTQPQTDALVVDEQVVASGREGDFVLAAQTNVPYDVTVPPGADWITFVSTRSLDERQTVFHLKANGTGRERSAFIILSGGEVIRRVTIRQLFQHPVMEETAFGAYALDGKDYVYRPGADQWSWSRKGGDGVFRMLNPVDRQVVSLQGIPPQPSLGDRFNLDVTVQEGIYHPVAARYSVTVLDASDGTLWLASDAAPGFVVREEAL